MYNFSSFISFLEMIDKITMNKRLINPIPRIMIPFQIPGLETAQMLERLDISSKLSLDYLNALQKSVVSINQLMPQLLENLSMIEDMEETTQKLREASKLNLLSLSDGIHVNGDSVEITEKACETIQNLTDIAQTDLSIPKNPPSSKKMSRRDFVLQVALPLLSFFLTILSIAVSMKSSASSHEDAEKILHEEIQQTQYLKEIVHNQNLLAEYPEIDPTDETSMHQFVNELPYWIYSLLSDIGEYYLDAADSLKSVSPEEYPDAEVLPESDTGNADPDTSFQYSAEYKTEE